MNIALKLTLKAPGQHIPDGYNYLIMPQYNSITLRLPGQQIPDGYNNLIMPQYYSNFETYWVAYT